MKKKVLKEMAKQVAHEIKNPLTPMKLRVQILKSPDPKGRILKKLVRLAHQLLNKLTL